MLDTSQLFLLFPPCFLPFPKLFSIFAIAFNLSSPNALNLGQSKILLFGKELRIPASRVIFVSVLGQSICQSPSLVLVKCGEKTLSNILSAAIHCHICGKQLKTCIKTNFVTCKWLGMH